MNEETKNKIGGLRGKIGLIKREWRGDSRWEVAIPLFSAMIDMIETQAIEIELLRGAQVSMKVDIDDLVDAVGYEEQKHEEAHR